MSEALERLIEAVAAGHVPTALFDAVLEGENFNDAVHAYSVPSMDAALSLKGSILPDHDWGRAPGGQMWVQRPPAAPVWSGDGYPPARGLLLAMLRAKLAENHQRQETSD